MSGLSEDIIFINGLPLPTRSARKKIVIVTLLFCWSIITYIVLMGDPSNSLHSSALAWCFSGSIATVFAYVFGAVFDNFTVIKNSNGKIENIPGS